MKNKMKRNIKLEYIFRFISSFTITEAVWVLYLSYKGLSLAQIGILEGIFHITSLVSEVPSGALADLMGRKKVLLLSRVFNVIASLIMIFSSHMWQFAISFLFSAWSYNLLSGSEEALVYDSFLCMGEEKKYYKTNSRIEVMIELSNGLATFAGGVMSEISFSLCYVMAALIAASSLIPCMLFEEPVLEQKQDQKKVTWKEHFVISFRIIKESKAVMNILFFYSFVFTFYTSVYFYCQQYFLELGMNKIQISVVMLLVGGTACLGAMLSEKMVNRTGERMKYTAVLFIGAGILGMALGNAVLSIGCLLVISFFNASLYPLQSASLNKLIPSEQRATIISVGSMVFSIFMIVLFPVMGFVADSFGLKTAFLVTGLCALSSMVFFGHRK